MIQFSFFFLSPLLGLFLATMNSYEVNLKRQQKPQIQFAIQSKLWFKATFKNREGKWDGIWGQVCLIFKHYYYRLMLTYFLCFLGGKSVVFKLENALFRDPFPSHPHGEVKGSISWPLCRQRSLSQDARVLPARIRCSCTTDTFLFLLLFPTFNDPLIEYWVEL